MEEILDAKKIEIEKGRNEKREEKLRNQKWEKNRNAKNIKHNMKKEQINYII